MTICIASIVNHSRLITITDKMLTLPAGVMTKYEASENNKSIELSDKVLALLAGNVIHGNEILKRAKLKITEGMSVEDIATLVKDTYVEYRQQLVQDGFFNSYGLTLESYMEKQLTLDPKFVEEANKLLVNVNLETAIIIAGIDDAPHLYAITNPGEMSCQDSIGYACIGSGSQHAMLSLIESEYNASFMIEEALYALLEAKRRAEYDPGVGNLSDISIIDGSVKRLSKEELKKIYENFNKTLENIRKIKVEGSKDIYKSISHASSNK
jgi:20S proteasome alpha/beta subunit